VLYHPQVDPRPLHLENADPEPPVDLTWQDAVNLYALPGEYPRAITSSNWLPTQVDAPNSALAMRIDRATTADLFGMFDMHFIYGAPWTKKDDDDRAQVVVLTKTLNDQLFNGENSVGRGLIIATKNFRVVGVMDDFNPSPHFYDLNSTAYKPRSGMEVMYLPFFTWLDLPQDFGYGPMDCWGNNNGHDPKTPNCSWVQFWVQLNSAAQAADYQRTLANYSAQQQQLGRFERAPNVRLRNVIDWLDYKRVIPQTVVMQSWIAFGVLLVCLVNAVGLLVAKFLRKSSEIGVRRAWGASRSAVFAQCLTESGLIGLMGGLLGLPMAWLGLLLVRHQPMAYASTVHMDLQMLAVALPIAIAATLLAGMWPAWRASRISPAVQVKLT
jgi:putative ABC transport system permease protein